ncbi:MAG TPA: hypothetical protein VGL66_03800 [Caulobacteraceae bacterium]
MTFWNHGSRLETLRTFLRAFFGEVEDPNAISPEDVCKELHLPVKDGHNIRNFIKKNKPTKTPRDLAKMTSIFKHIFTQIELDDPIAGTTAYEQAAKLFAKLTAHEHSESETDAYKENIKNSLVEFISSGIEVTAGSLRQLESELFDKHAKQNKNRLERYYYCYRYDSKAGLVVRSHLTIKGRDARRNGVIYFTNKLRREDGLHEAHGVVLPLRGSIYLLAVVDKGMGLTQVALRSLANDMVLTGLFQSVDQGGLLVCGRIILIPTQDPYVDKGKKAIDVAPLKDMETELDGQVGKIANKILFNLNAPVLLDGVPIEEASFVELVGKALAKQGEKLTLSDGHTPFNPAATKHYTFNVALKDWTDGEG